ncbi:YbbR-like domain-containing protein [Algibacter sp. 2305UL17-15]|uniref:YbbR-like domain-containing protein n=1 Tax=Algibacter sp. 2305UL17-15 TaxID=3231268 RepID=UPI00345829D3
MIKKLKTELLTSIKNKRLNVFLLFLFSAFVILIFTKLSKDYTNTLTFNIKKINVPQEKVILNDSNNKLELTLKTHGFKWLKYYFTKPEITIDFSKEVSKLKGAYVYTKPVSYLNEKKQFQNQIKLLNVSPDTLVFKYDTNMVKKIPVLANTDITFAPGFDVLRHYRTDPDSVVVVGPHELVQELEVLETELVTLKDIKKNISQTVKLVLPENQKNLKFSVKEVELIADVEKFTEGTVKIPVDIINLPDSLSIKYFPKEIKVSYYTSLSHFNSISSNDFKVVCDFKKVSNNQSNLIPEITRFPENVKRIKLSQQHIEFIILK